MLLPSVGNGWPHLYLADKVVDVSGRVEPLRSGLPVSRWPLRSWTAWVATVCGAQTAAPIGGLGAAQKIIPGST